MYKRIAAIVCAACLLLCAGCNSSIRGTVEDEKVDLPSLDLSSELICVVEQTNGQLCTVKVVEGNSTYDRDDTLYVTWLAVEDDEAVTRGDYLRFRYDYISDVSAMDGTPHIEAESVTVLDRYTPPETTAEPTEAQDTDASE